MPNLFEKIFRFLRSHLREIAFLAFIFISYWFVYTFGQIIETQSLVDAQNPIAGKKPFSEVVSLAEQNQIHGKLLIGPDVRFKDQFGNLWEVPDFSQSVSQRALDSLRSKRIEIEGDIRIDLINSSVASRQAAVSAIMDNITRLVLFVFYGFLVFFFYTQLKNTGGFMGKSFRQYDAKAGTKTSITFSDVAGHHGAKTEIMEIVDYLRDPERFSRTGARPPRGVLLYGPPGNGKTLLAKAVSGEAAASYLEQNASSFMQMFVGMGAARVRELFREARKIRPCVIFIDEIDSIGASRSQLSGSHDERIQTINALLAELDGFEDNSGIVVIAATNRLEHLDEALIRPGRFDRKVFIPLPGKADRLEILQVHAKKIPRLTADLSRWASRTQGFSGADLGNLVNEAAMEAARLGIDTVGDTEFSKARERILMGPRNHGHTLSDAEREIVAFHEAGHACMRVVAGDGRLEKVSILPHGMALGVTISEQMEERLLVTKKEIERELLVMMGGRAAEEVFLGSITSGAANDMEKASHLAREAIFRYGFDAFGPYIPEHPELTREVENKAVEWVQNAYAEAKRILRENEFGVRALARELLASEEVDGDAARDLLLASPEAPSS